MKIFVYGSFLVSIFPTKCFIWSNLWRSLLTILELLSATLNCSETSFLRSYNSSLPLWGLLSFGINFQLPERIAIFTPLSCIRTSLCLVCFDLPISTAKPSRLSGAWPSGSLYFNRSASDAKRSTKPIGASDTPGLILEGHLVINGVRDPPS
jgi:hypothetical protein